MPYGTTVPDAVGPASLHGRVVSLNFKMCKYLDMPTRDPELHLDTNRPTIQVPDAGQIAKIDLNGLWLAIQAGKIVIQDHPVPEFTKIPEVMERHVGVVSGNFPEGYVKDYVKTEVVNGPNNQGGYSKLQILEAMLEAEEINPVTGSGGRNRKEIVRWIKDAIGYVENVYGGVSKVRREAISHEESSSMKRFTPANINASKANRILGIE